MNWRSPYAATGLLASALIALPLHAQTSAVVNAERVNLRGQPTTRSEVITQLRLGETVAVLEQIVHDRPAPGDPARGSKIRLPSDVPVWVYGPNVDPITKRVQAESRNIRTGPGLNFSVIGELKAGDEVREIRTLDDWMEIVAPESSYAFVASSFLELQAGRTFPSRTMPVAGEQATSPSRDSSPPEVVIAAPTTYPPSTPSTRLTQGTQGTEPRVSGWDAYRVRGQPNSETSTAPVTSWPTSTRRPEQVARRPLETAPAPAVTSETLSLEPVDSSPAVVAETPERNVPGAVESLTPEETPEPSSTELAPAVATSETRTLSVEPEPAEPVMQTIPARSSSIVPGERRQRIVRREGIVKRTRSIQAPTPFELRATDTRKRINYLLPLSTAVSIRSYAGQRVIVTGEEMIESRWPKAPVIEVRKIVLAP